MNAPYTDTIRTWASDTRRVGTLKSADGIGEVGLKDGEVGRRLAVRFALCVADGRVATVRFQVFGCGFTIAACAAAADLAEGRFLSEVVSITPGAIDAVLGGLPTERDYCASLAGEALQAAIKSVRIDRHPVQATVAGEDDHAPRVSRTNEVYRLLVDSPSPPGAAPEDRHLFACALAIAAGEPYNILTTLGLRKDELDKVMHSYFPALALADLVSLATPASGLPPLTNADLLNVLLTYLPHDANGCTPAPSLWLAQILAARAAHPGHLWRAMGLFTRAELTVGIRRHLPALAHDNHQGMRWKRFFYKKLCEQSGGVLCKTPDCGACSDYAMCFEVTEQPQP